MTVEAYHLSHWHDIDISMSATSPYLTQSIQFEISFPYRLREADFPQIWTDPAIVSVVGYRNSGLTGLKVRGCTILNPFDSAYKSWNDHVTKWQIAQLVRVLCRQLGTQHVEQADTQPGSPFPYIS